MTLKGSGVHRLQAPHPHHPIQSPTLALHPKHDVVHHCTVPEFRRLSFLTWAEMGLEGDFPSSRVRFWGTGGRVLGTGEVVLGAAVLLSLYCRGQGWAQSTGTANLTTILPV